MGHRQLLKLGNRTLPRSMHPRLAFPRDLSLRGSLTAPFFFISFHFVGAVLLWNVVVAMLLEKFVDVKLGNVVCTPPNTVKQKH